MLYLLYIRSGFIKKFPLKKKSIVIGRSTKSDLVINESFISLKHGKIEVFGDHITIEDLGSTNGIFIETTRIHKAKIEINQYFRVGYSNFFLKEGNAKDFVVSKKVQPVLNKISNMMDVEGGKTKEAINLLYTKPLIEMLEIGFMQEDLSDIFKYAKKLFDKTLEKGSLVLISKENNNSIIESGWNYSKKQYPSIFEILQIEDIFEKPYLNNKIADTYTFCSFPFVLSSKYMLLIYILKDHKPIHQNKIDFLKDLSVEISIIDSLIEQNKLIPGRETHTTPEIITNNQIFLNILTKSKKIAVSDLFVIIEGETGTGKELIAKYIHSKSKRASKDFVALNCAAIPENLIEDELFGHEKGAFTDARDQRKGKLELSSGGTLVLDEIGDMPLVLQKKLLRAIQEGVFYRVGGNKPIKVDLRIICLTHKNILELIKKDEFRQDLYYRLNHVALTIHPLRERKEDIIPLINHYVKVFSRKSKLSIKGFTKEALKALEMYDWPGNVRELENEIKKIISLSEDDDVIDLSSLKNEIIEFYSIKSIPSELSETGEKEHILKVLNKHKWNKTMAAKELGISRTALYDKIKKHKIK
ncbi:MAG: sigma 54-interacting transcriptional regulator [Acidobacteriota bacterium]